MDHLSSCYFCGVAMDQPLQQYRVVPVELRDDDEVTTATLCPSCHGKLERLLGPVVRAAGGEDVTLDATDRPTAGSEEDPLSGDTTDRTTADSSSDERPESDVSTGADVTANPDDAEAVDEADVDAPAVDGPDADLLPESEIEGDTLDEGMEPDVPDELASESGGAAVDDTGPESETGADGAGTDGDGTDTQAGSEEHIDSVQEAGEPGASGELQSGEGGGTDEGEDENGGPDPDERAETKASADAGSEGDEGEDEPAASTGSEADPTGRTTVSALEYNKVMRLLQNREFPVDRAEIETVAANAYGLARSECAAVIDLAIDRGLIAEEGDKLVRPD